MVLKCIRFELIPIREGGYYQKENEAMKKKKRIEVDKVIIGVMLMAISY